MRYLIAGAIVMVALTMTASAVLADVTPGPLDVFAKHEAAVGYSLADGNARPYVLTMISTYVDFYKNPHRSLTVRKQAGAFYRSDTAFLGSTDVSGFGNAGFWTSSPNGNLATDSGVDRQLDVTWAVIDSEGLDNSLAPELRYPQGDDEVVRIHPPSGLPADIYFNRSTWLIDRVIIDPDGRSLRREYRDYVRHGPIMVAMTRYVDDLSIKVTKFEWDAPLTVNEFEPPTPRHYANFPAGGSVTMPFDNSAGVVFVGSVNGAPGRFILDTGTSGIFLGPLWAAKAHLVNETQHPNWAAEFMAFPSTSNVSIGAFTLKNVCVGELDDNYFDWQSAPFDGIIGYDLFAAAIVSIDFDRLTLTLSDPATVAAPSASLALPFALNGGVPDIAAVADGVDVSMQMQLGWRGELAMWRSLGNQPRRVGGEVHRFTIERYVLAHIWSDDLGQPKDYWPGTGSNGYIGYYSLKTFNLTFDYPHRIVYLVPNKRG